MGINNFINFLSLKDVVHIYYVVYIFAMLCYQGALLGVYRIFIGGLAETLIANVIALGTFYGGSRYNVFQIFFEYRGKLSLTGQIFQGFDSALYGLQSYSRFQVSGMKRAFFRPCWQLPQDC